VNALSCEIAFRLLSLYEKQHTARPEANVPVALPFDRWLERRTESRPIRSASDQAEIVAA